MKRRYEIIGADTLGELRDGVDRWVERGYVPQGGPFRSERGPYTYVQALWLPNGTHLLDEVESRLDEIAPLGDKYDRKQAAIAEECGGEPY